MMVTLACPLSRSQVNSTFRPFLSNAVNLYGPEKSRPKIKMTKQSPITSTSAPSKILIKLKWLPFQFKIMGKNSQHTIISIHLVIMRGVPSHQIIKQVGGRCWLHRWSYRKFQKSLMVTSSYFTHPTTVYSKACTIPGFDIVATSPRRSRRSLAPPEGGGAGFAEFPAGGTTSNKSKIF